MLKVLRKMEKMRSVLSTAVAVCFIFYCVVRVSDAQHTGLFLGQYNFTAEDLSVTDDGLGRIHLILEIPNESLYLPTDAIVRSGSGLLPRFTYSREETVATLQKGRDLDRGVTFFELGNFILEVNYTIQMFRDSIPISDKITLLTTSLQSIVAEDMSEEHVWYIECHFLPNTQTDGCQVTWIPIDIGVSRNLQQTTVLIRGENGTALVANEPVNIMPLTTYRVQAYGINEGQVLHTFPIFPNQEGSSSRETTRIQTNDMMTTGETTIATEMGANDSANTLTDEGLGLILGMSAIALVLIVVCMVIGVCLIVYCKRSKQCTGRRRRKKRPTAMKKTDDFILTRPNSSYEIPHTLNTSLQNVHNFYDKLAVAEISEEPDYENVSLNGRQISASPVGSPVPGPSLWVENETQTRMATLKKSTSVGSGLYENTRVNSHGCQSNKNVQLRGSSTLIRQMCENTERRDHSRSLQVSPARIRDPSQTKLYTSKSLIAKRMSKPRVSAHNPSIVPPRDNLQNLTSSASRATLSPSQATNSLGQGGYLELQPLSSERVGETDERRFERGSGMTDHHELPLQNQKKQKANTLKAKSQQDGVKLPPQDYEIPITTKSMPRNIQPNYRN